MNGSQEQCAGGCNVHKGMVLEGSGFDLVEFNMSERFTRAFAGGMYEQAQQMLSYSTCMFGCFSSTIR